jgi:hypothetical protein
LIILIILGEVCIMRLSPGSCISSHFVPNILLSILFSNTLNLCSSLNGRENISHPYKTTEKIIVFYTAIFTFVGSRREDRVLDLMIPSVTRILSLLICSWIEFKNNCNLKSTGP